MRGRGWRGVIDLCLFSGQWTQGCSQERSRVGWNLHGTEKVRFCSKAALEAHSSTRLLRVSVLQTAGGGLEFPPRKSFSQQKVAVPVEGIIAFPLLVNNGNLTVIKGIAHVQ